MAFWEWLDNFAYAVFRRFLLSPRFKREHKPESIPGFLVTSTIVLPVILISSLADGVWALAILASIGIVVILLLDIRFFLWRFVEGHEDYPPWFNADKNSGSNLTSGPPEGELQRNNVPDVRKGKFTDL